MLFLSNGHFALPLLDICILGCFGTGWLDCCSLTLYCACPRTSPCLGRNPFFFALPAVGSALVLPAVGSALVGSLIRSPLLDVERCSASASSLRCSSRCPQTRVASLRSSRHWLVGCGILVVLKALSLILSRDTLWYFAISWMPRPNTTTQHCALRDRWLAVRAGAHWSCNVFC